MTSVSQAEILLRQRRFAEAAEIYTRLLPDIRDEPRHLVNLGGTLIELSRFKDAAHVLQRVVAMEPGRWSAWSNLGIALMEQQLYSGAISAFAQAIELNPRHVPSLSGAGVALRRAGRPEEAIRLFDLALNERPEDADLHYYRAMALLALGQYREGFREFEWRLLGSGVRPTMVEAPRWQGEIYHGRSLLVQGEGGYGDMLQFCRYLPLAARRGGHLLVLVPPQLRDLFSRLEGVATVLCPGDTIPPVDYQCPMMSLPLVFECGIETIPTPGGYLRPEPELIEVWGARLDAHDIVRNGPPDLRVELVWSGGIRPWHRDNMLWNDKRSLTLQSLAALASHTSEATFYSLQVGPAGEEAREPPAGMRLVDFTPELATFADTAALIVNLDVVVSVDTSAAHLTGALGKPLMLLSSYDHCWRWLIGSNTSPWYESVRIYQQTQPGEWATPIARVAEDLGGYKRSDRVPDRRAGSGPPPPSRENVLHVTGCGAEPRATGSGGRSES